MDRLSKKECSRNRYRVQVTRHCICYVYGSGQSEQELEAEEVRAEQIPRD